jgi:ABC-type polysaccharide/polyol phosphate export systems, permease component
MSMPFERPAAGDFARDYIAGIPASLWTIALRDLIAGIRDHRLWMFLGWQDIRQRYRRSVLGPFWLTLSTGIMVVMMGVLYGRLFKMPLGVYLPFLASGTIIWGLISALINEGCASFMAVDSLIKQVRMPLSLHVCRMIWRNLVVFFHNVVILIPAWVFFHKGISLVDIAAALTALVAIAVNALWAGTVLGALCTRFRDIGPLIGNLVQIVFFVTPIMWMPATLSGRGIARWLVAANPFYHFIEILREPLLGAPVPMVSWEVVGGVTILGFAAGAYMLGRFRNRIPYWL